MGAGPLAQDASIAIENVQGTRSAANWQKRECFFDNGRSFH